MSDIESGRPRRPRRALEPLEAGDDDRIKDDSLSADDSDGPSPSRAWVAADSADEAPAAEPEVSTPIPPPAPTLPEPLQPPEAGRRFSAEPVADDWISGAPRRSAASVSSPPPLDEAESSAAAPLDPEQAKAAVVEPDGAQGHPKRRLWTIIASAVAAVLVLAVVVWFSTQRSGTTANPPVTSPTAAESLSPSPTAPVSEAELLAAADLAKLRKSTTWSAVDATASPAAQPACIELSSTGGAAPQGEAGRRYAANRDGGALIQVAQAMADTQAAGTAYDALLAQAAGCSDAVILSAYRVDGLADAATALVTQHADNTRHTLLITRTGRFVNVTDASVNAGSPVSVTGLSAALATSLAKQCSAATGTCPSTVKVIGTPPPATPTLGWLAFVDLPRVTPGQGTWTATDPKAPDLQGSECENVDLNKLTGSTRSAHRIYLLTDDQKAPEGFGIDQAVYTFGKASAAAAMAKTLDGNFASCGDRTRTATVSDDAVTAVDASGKKLKGTTYLVTQRVSDTKTVTFRVAVAVTGTRLVYLLANPSSGFDFSANQWQAIVGRAAQRATQFA
ncbi:MAG: hypothetical protein IPL41_13850 [Micropruina sp.]|nr:hypothetical protein [Micropruina sp.]